MRIVFLGTPDISVPLLERLVQQHQVVGVVTQPDKPTGRGYKLKPSPVKKYALKQGLKIFQPAIINTAELIAELGKLSPELGVVVAYGQILSPGLFNLPRLGCLNVHFSLLPKYRGPAPVQWALINGERETGITIFWITEKVDAGPILRQETIPIKLEDDYPSLSKRLAERGGELLIKSIELLISRQAPKISQDPGQASYARFLKKEDGKIDWQKNAGQVWNLIRGANPWPGTYVKIKSQKSKIENLKILKVKPVEDILGVPNARAGEIVEIRKGESFVVKCGQGYLNILEVQPEGKRPMSGYEYLIGHHLKAGDSL